MTGKTHIQWTEKTWNPVVGCSIISPGCKNCYAMKWAGRRMDGNPNAPHYAGTTQPSNAGPVWTGKLSMAPDHIVTAPLRWRKPAMIFVNSMSDLFHEDMPTAWIDRIFAIMALTPHHTYQVLTKRAERMRAYMTTPGLSGRLARAVLDLIIAEGVPKGYLTNKTYDDRWPVASDNDEDPSDVWLKAWPLPNVWLGVSVEDQTRADQRIPDLLATPAAIRWISAEPLLGLLNLEAYLDPSAFCQHCDDGEGYGSACESHHAPRHAECPFRRATQIVREIGPYNAEGMPSRMDCEVVTLNWVVVGGESTGGSKARPMHPDWVRAIRDQCAAAGVPFFFKQWGDWAPIREWEPQSRKIMTAIDATGEPVPYDIAPEDVGGQRFMMVGKKEAEDYLDGQQHHQWPEATR